MAIAITQVVIDAYLRGQLSVHNLRTVCFAVGIRPDLRKQESDSLIKKLKPRCEDLRPLLAQTELKNIFGTAERLGKRSLPRRSAPTQSK